MSKASGVFSCCHRPSQSFSRQQNIPQEGVEGVEGDTGERHAMSHWPCGQLLSSHGGGSRSWQVPHQEHSRHTDEHVRIATLVRAARFDCRDEGWDAGHETSLPLLGSDLSDAVAVVMKTVSVPLFRQCHLAAVIVGQGTWHSGESTPHSSPHADSRGMHVSCLACWAAATTAHPYL